jgi:predicted dehydrogenase
VISNWRLTIASAVEADHNHRWGGIVRDAQFSAYRKAGYIVVALCDPDLRRADELASEYGIQDIYASPAEATTASPTDGILDVATPPDAFVEILSALPEGAAVLIQKPPGTCLEQARQIQGHVMRRHGDNNSAGHQFAFAE